MIFRFYSLVSGIYFGISEDITMMVMQRVSPRFAALKASFKSVVTLHYVDTEHSRHTNIRGHIFA